MSFGEAVLTPPTKNNFIYPYLLGRHRVISPWTRVSVIGHLLYVSANLLTLRFRPSMIANVGHWAGVLSLVNMAVLFAGSPLVYFAGIVGVSLRASHCHTLSRGLDVWDVVSLPCYYYCDNGVGRF
jgi:hypothetical protein